VQEGKGTSAVVSAPGGRLSTWEAVIGMKVMMSGWRLNYCNLDRVLVGRRKEILWPFFASLFAS
jgi:hypothetical protein